MSPSDVERRFAELQTEVTGRKLGGYAAVFNQVTDIGRYLEQLSPNTFRSALDSGQNVAGLLNHDPNMLLASTRNGSLRLSTDTHGLQFELDLPDTTTGNDVRSLVESGLLNKCSFSFLPGEQDWTMHEGRRLCTRTSVKRLLDVSVVTIPAYEGTSVSMRSQNLIDDRTRLILARAAHLPKGI